jgi:hypothetical protein
LALGISSLVTTYLVAANVLAAHSATKANVKINFMEPLI